MSRVLAIALVCAACRPPDPAPVQAPPEQLALLAQRDRGDVAAMRAHVWDVFARIQPVWRSWPRSDQVFGVRDRVFRALQPFRDGDRVVAEQLPVMFAVVFDPIAARHVERYRLATAAALRGFGTNVPEFPRDAITLKLVWYPVHARGTTELPVWDGEPARAGGNPDVTWSRHVTIDPAGVAGVPLDRFLHAELHDGPELAAARAIAHDPTLAAGDHVVLLGMHVSTKEIPDWIWATFWWHDRPDDGPHAAGRPAGLTGAARHYLMDVAYSAETPGGAPAACMNPYLEARFPDGLASNCVACHQRAAFGALDYLPVTRGAMRTDDPYFGGKTTTDFVWSLALEAR